MRPSAVPLDDALADLLEAAREATEPLRQGCGYYNGSGYPGRTAIHEVLKVDEEIRELITEKASTSQLRRVAARKGFRDLRFDGLRKVVAGQTTLEEVIRATKAVEWAGP